MPICLHSSWGIIRTWPCKRHPFGRKRGLWWLGAQPSPAAACRCFLRDGHDTCHLGGTTAADDDSLLWKGTVKQSHFQENVGPCELVDKLLLNISVIQKEWERKIPASIYPVPHWLCLRWLLPAHLQNSEKNIWAIPSGTDPSGQKSQWKTAILRVKVLKIFTVPCLLIKSCTNPLGKKQQHAVALRDDGDDIYVCVYKLKKNLVII